MIKAGTIILRDSRLLIAKPKTNPFWIFVGGRIEPGETHEQCLRREIREELSAEITEHHLFMKNPHRKGLGRSAQQNHTDFCL